MRQHAALAQDRSRDGSITLPPKTDRVTLQFPYTHLFSEAFRIQTLRTSARNELSKKFTATVRPPGSVQRSPCNTRVLSFRFSRRNVKL